MHVAGAIVGNSSSALIEAPSFGLPAINVGSRQKGRERAQNVIDVPYSRIEIRDAINKALHDNEFREKVKLSGSPYGDGHASERIVKILLDINITPELLKKKITY